MKVIEAFDMKAHTFNLLYMNKIYHKTVFGGVLYISLFLALGYIFMKTLYSLISGEKIIITNISSNIDEPNLWNINLFKEGEDDIQADLYWVQNQDNIDEFYKYFRPYLRVGEQRWILDSEIVNRTQTNHRKLLIKVPRDRLVLRYFIGRAWDIDYNVYWGFDSCLMLNNTNLQQSEGKLMNPEKLNDCSDNLNEFYQNNSQIIQTSYFKMWYYLNNTLIDQQGNENKNFRPQSIIKFSLRDNIEEVFIHSFSLLILERDKSIFFEEKRTKYIVNYDWVRKEGNLDVGFYYGYRNKILLCNPTFSYYVKLQISFYKVIDVLSFLGGLMKFVQFISFIKVLVNDYNQDRIYADLGYLFYYEKNKLADSPLLRKNTKLDYKNKTENHNSYYFKNSDKESTLNLMKINDFESSQKSEFFDSYCKGNIVPCENRLNDSKDTDKGESVGLSFHENANINYSDTLIPRKRKDCESKSSYKLQKISYMQWIIMKLSCLLCCAFKRRKYKAFDHQLKIYRNLFSVENLLIQYSNINLMKNHFEITEKKDTSIKEYLKTTTIKE